MYSGAYQFSIVQNEEAAKNDNQQRTPPPEDNLKPKPEASTLNQAEIAADATSLDYRLLKQLGIGKPLLDLAAGRARAYGTSLETELLASGQIAPETYYEAIAELLGVPFLREIPDGQISDSDVLDTQLVETSMVRVNRTTQSPIIALCPKIEHLPAIKDRCETSLVFKESIAVATPATIRRAVWRAGENRRIAMAKNQLFDEQPQMSARATLSGSQGYVAGTCVTALAGFALYAPWPTFQVVHFLLSMAYLASLALRFMAARPWRHKQTLTTEDNGRRPIYTVLVPLYEEDKLIPQLVSALERLEWPVSRLDIKLICEADDPSTIAAARAFATKPQFEVIEVPPSEPRTKPKALNYALAAARGEFIAIYDAEDRPHPRQLIEAHSRFESDDKDLACLQAPLVIANGSQNWITALFALEYSALFRTILPMLASFRMPLPLGGTSNHFRGLMYQTHHKATCQERLK